MSVQATTILCKGREKRAAARRRAGAEYADTLGVLFDHSPEQQFDYGVTTFIDGVRQQLEA